MEDSQIAVSPCSNPEMDLDEVLSAYARIGFRKFEVFTGGLKSAFDCTGDLDLYRSQGEACGMRFHSLHLPPVQAERLDETLDAAVRCAAAAARIGAEIVLYKASDRDTYVRAAPRFLDRIDGLGVTPVIQNHFGTPVTSLDDMKAVIEGIADPRMKALLEVGHFHSAGVSWNEAADSLGDSIALVHVKDQIGRQSVPFGEGEIDLPGLFGFMDRAGYDGVYVVEMEVRDKENTLAYLARALEYVRAYCGKATR
ncbi:MAG TPA: TIM barrel protein [Phycisphaerae bacterium]|nr:TIM barrel protein [Phycisphaerae bacterium]